MNHLLIDFENIRPENLNRLNEEHTHIWLFLGVNQQKNIALELCESLCRFGKNVHFVRVAKAGKNALDFYLSFYLGKITEQDPQVLIGILSKDGGYDVLIEHIQDNGLASGIVRLVSLDDIQLLPNTSKPSEIVIPKIAAGSAESASENQVQSGGYSTKDLSLLVQALREPQAFLPRSYGNLVSRIQNIILADQWTNYTDELRQTQAENLVAALLKKGLIEKQPDGLLTYHLDAEFILKKIEERALSSKAKTLEKLYNVIRSSLAGFGIEADSHSMQQFASSLEKRQLIRINQSKITYAPFMPSEKIEVLPQKTAKATVYQPNTSVWQKILALLNKKNRPTKLSGLRNILKSQEKSLGLKDGEIELLLTRLQTKKHIKVENGKLQYKAELL
ncbi:PIN domain-containing protein [Neisseria animaloris]|uniref:PIN domain-containing protein n=1 Tax=Neisseria animaloris TaxID=326522 RepID=UPI000D2F8A96|nr:PIN domain-containing protein [Neisseria animaloris]